MPIPIFAWILGLGIVAFLAMLAWLFGDDEEKWMSYVKDKFRKDVKSFFKNIENQIGDLSTTTPQKIVEVLRKLNNQINDEIEFIVNSYIDTFHNGDNDEAKKSLETQLMDETNEIAQNSTFYQQLKEKIQKENQDIVDDLI